MTARPLRVTIAGVDPQVIEADVLTAEPDTALPAPVIGTVHRADADGRRRVEVVIDGWRFEAVIEDAARAELRDRASRDRAALTASGGPLEIHAIIPGRIVDVRVTVDDVVEVGQALLVVEAMKMQNELRAPRGGTITSVVAAAGTTVDVGDLLVVIG